MKQLIKPGKYVVAVSGGVDSVVLLDMLTKQQSVELIVTHYDHGIRSTSARDRDLAARLAENYDLSFEYEEGRLGPAASEELARKKRYDFLGRIKEKYDAQAIVTAHHQDDVLETVIINLLRGTGRKGLSSLQSTKELVRPLLSHTKQDLITYAEAHDLHWNEDETNEDQAYLRNWVRLNIIPKLTPEQRSDLLARQAVALENNKTIDHMLDSYISSVDPRTLNKRDITELPHAVAVELIAHWLRINHVREVDTKLLNRLTLGAKTLLPGKSVNVKGGVSVKIAAKKLQLEKE